MVNFSPAGMNMREFRDINSGREVFYNFLSRCYKKEVDEDFLCDACFPYALYRECSISVGYR